MTFKTLSSFGLLTGLAFALPALGCPADDTTDGDDTAGNDATAGDDGDGDGMTDAPDDGMTDAPDDGMDDDPDSGTTDGPGSCPGGGGAAATDEACAANSDCMSGVCLLFADVPAPTDAVCGDVAADCSMRATATIFDFDTGSRVGGATVRVVPAIQAATNPTGAPALIEGTTDADGVFDAVSDGQVSAPVGIVALVESGEYFLTATGMAGPNEANVYGVANNIHDIWAVPKASLDAWSAVIGMDAAVPAESMPLGEMGGVVGIVRDAAGEPVSRASIVSDIGADSDSIVRYLADDESWAQDATGGRGIFTIISPGLAEAFHAEVDGATVGNSGQAGSAPGAIFTLVFNLP